MILGLSLLSGVKAKITTDEALLVRPSVPLVRFFARMRGSRRMDRKAEEETNGSAIRDDDNEASRCLGRADE